MMVMMMIAIIIIIIITTIAVGNQTLPMLFIVVHEILFVALKFYRFLV